MCTIYSFNLAESLCRKMIFILNLKNKCFSPCSFLQWKEAYQITKLSVHQKTTSSGTRFCTEPFPAQLLSHVHAYTHLWFQLLKHLTNLQEMYVDNMPLKDTPCHTFLLPKFNNHNLVKAQTCTVGATPVQLVTFTSAFWNGARASFVYVYLCRM